MDQTPSSTPPAAAGPRPVLALVADLLFRSKIDAAATNAGLTLRVARSAAQLDRHLAAGLVPSIILVDLEDGEMDPAALIGRLKADPRTADAPLLGFAGHTNVAAIRAGRDAGADKVLARSAMTQMLPEMMREVAALEAAR
jgi:CheY-like chemotaxis protein